MELVFSENAPAAVGPYSQGFVHNGILFASGAIPVNPSTGKVEGEDVSSQAHQVCKNVKAVLDAAGTGFDKVIKTTCYLADMADFAAFNSVYAEYFTSKPARSCVAVKGLPMGVLCEIEVTAVVD